MTAAQHIGNPGNPETDQKVLAAALRLVTFPKRQETPVSTTFEKAIDTFCKVIEMLAPRTDEVVVADDDKSRNAAMSELNELRRCSSALDIIVTSDVFSSIRESDRPRADQLASKIETATSASIERVNARRAYLAWVLDENDDQELGREIDLPMPENVKAGPSAKSFAW